MDRRLLLVHAHPDDECINQGATMAKYVAEGVGVTLITCTAGEMGEVLVPELEHLAADRDDRLGEHRRSELDAAMAILGVVDHRFLGGFGKFRDSGMKWHPDGHAIPADDIHANAFWHADLLEAAADLVAVIREVRPQVMVTYDEFGFYGHPDHIQAHRVATYAAALAAAAPYRPDLGAAHDITKIYWGAISREATVGGMRQMQAQGVPIQDEDIAGFEPMLTPDALITTEVDARAFAQQKYDAMLAHATQITLEAPFLAAANVLGVELLGLECFRIAKGTVHPDTPGGRESDLFAGLS